MTKNVDNEAQPGGDEAIRPPLSPVPEPGRIEARQKEIISVLSLMSYTVLKRDELTAEYVDLLAQSEQGGQFDQPRAGGVQKTNKFISEAARRLVMLGKSEEARRKFIERAVKVACISAEANTAIVAAGLDNVRGALLAIAKEPTPERQLKKLGEIAARRQASRRRRVPGQTGAATTTLPEASDVGIGVSVVPELSPDRDGSIVPAQVRFDHDTAYAELMTAWKASPEFQRLWRRSPRITRERFIDFQRSQETDEIGEASPNATKRSR